MKTILIAIDINDNVDYIINIITGLLDLKSTKTWLVHVAAPDPDFVGYEAGPQYIRDDRAHTLREEHSWLAGYSNRLQASGYNVEALLIQGATIETLCQETIKLGADLLIMGRHKHGWLYNLFNEPTTKGTNNLLNIPLLTIPLNKQVIKQKAA